MRNRFSLILTMAFGLSCAVCQSFAQELTVAPAHLVCDYNVPEKLDNQVKSKLQRNLRLSMRQCRVLRWFPKSQ